MAHLSGEDRATYVRGMFSRIARRYGLMNRLMTAGQDRRWRRFVVERAGLRAGGALLDIATGTGDIACEALKERPTARVVGGDFNIDMMEVEPPPHLNARAHYSLPDTVSPWRI
jgi:demethylmenaquinone methyltransferase / 2-methoxy-6-polyprenyl-1,4-benzoquinol methylase